MTKFMVIIRLYGKSVPGKVLNYFEIFKKYGIISKRYLVLDS